MRHMFQKTGYFVVIATLALAAPGCEDAGEEQTPEENDSLAVVPIGPGTRPDAIRSPDTPGSRGEMPTDTAADTLPR